MTMRCMEGPAAQTTGHTWTSPGGRHSRSNTDCVLEYSNPEIMLKGQNLGSRWQPAQKAARAQHRLGSLHGGLCLPQEFTGYYFVLETVVNHSPPTPPPRPCS